MEKLRKLWRMPVWVVLPLSAGVGLMLALVDRLPEPVQDGLFVFAWILILWGLVALIWHFFATKRFSLKASLFGPRLGGALEHLVYLSQITVEDKVWADEKILKFFLRGYNATKFNLKFKINGGNIFYSKSGGDPRKLPVPALEVPWTHEGSDCVSPYKEFGLHIVQTLSSEAMQEIGDALEGEVPVRFSFDNLEIFADTVGKKHKPTSLDFKQNNWTTIDLVRRGGRFSVSKVVHMRAEAIVLGKVRISGKGEK